MYTQTGSCPRCGAPIYVKTINFSVLPPAPMKTCMCFPEPTVVTSGNSTNCSSFKHRNKLTYHHKPVQYGDDRVAPRVGLRRGTLRHRWQILVFRREASLSLRVVAAEYPAPNRPCQTRLHQESSLGDIDRAILSHFA